MKDIFFCKIDDHFNSIAELKIAKMFKHFTNLIR